jgi:hypothetical protein
VSSLSAIVFIESFARFSFLFFDAARLGVRSLQGLIERAVSGGDSEREADPGEKARM